MRSALAIAFSADSKESLIRCSLSFNACKIGGTAYFPITKRNTSIEIKTQIAKPVLNERIPPPAAIKNIYVLFLSYGNSKSQDCCNNSSKQCNTLNKGCCQNHRSTNVA